MNEILKYFIIISIAGAIGNYIAVRKKNKANRRKWWLKYFTYILWAGAVICGILYISNFYFYMACIISIIGIYEILKNLKKVNIKNTTILVLYLVIASCYIGFSLNFQMNLFLGFFIIICLFDAFCQITGQIFGTKKIIKSISPQKTLEGYIGGTIITVLFVFAVIKNLIITEQSWTKIVFFVTLGAACGDLLSSILKRYLGIKDFSNLFPGQGGVLDRYDSHIFAGTTYFCFHFLS